MERELAALADRPAEEEEGYERHLSLGNAAAADELGDDAEVEGARHDAEEEDADEEAQIAEAGHDEGLLRRRRGLWLLVPEAYEEVGAQAHELPGHVQQDEVVGQHEDEHGESEKREVREEAPEARVVAHVAQAVDLHEEADAGHDHRHEGGERVDQNPDGDRDPPGVEPGDVGRDRCGRRDLVDQYPRGAEEGQGRRGYRNPGAQERPSPGEQQREGEGGEREQRRGEGG